MKLLRLGAVALMMLCVEHASAAVQMYWTTAQTSVYRANSDGSSQEVVFAGSPSGNGQATHIGIHEASQQLYIYGFANTVNFGPGFVKRSNLDGTGLGTVIDSGLGTIQYGFDIDQTNDRMYMGSTGPWRRSNLDGFGLIDLPNPTGVSYTHDMEVDEVNSKVYFTRDQVGLFRMDLDGNNLEALATPSHAFGMALDLDNNALYYSAFDRGQSLGTNGVIRSYDLLTGTNTLVASGIAALDLELDADTRTLYAITNTEIKTIDLADSSVASVLTLAESYNYNASLSLHTLHAAVPEPASIAVWSLLGIVGYVTVRRRRRR